MKREREREREREETYIEMMMMISPCGCGKSEIVIGTVDDIAGAMITGHTPKY